MIEKLDHLSRIDSLANRQVAAFIGQLKAEYGMEDAELDELVQALRLTIKMRRRMNRMGGWFGQAVITALVVGVMMAIWEGFKIYMSLPAGGHGPID